MCEVIDNCVDNPVADQKVEVDVIIEEEIAKSIESDSFRVYIYDRANGFESEDKFHAAFELTHAEGQPSSIQPSDKKIGKFFYGMKVAPLTKFEHFSLITEIEGEYLIRSTRYPGEDNEFKYVWRKEGVLGTEKDNPYDSAPVHLGLEGIKKVMSDGSYKTCAVMSCPRVELTKRPHNKTDKLYYDDLISHLSSFLDCLL